MAEINSILLAAGGSRRMGSPKQLLPWGNTTLIEHQIGILMSLTKNVIVVLGANFEIIVPVIEKPGVTIVINRDWETGMGSSIASGIRQIIAGDNEAGGALIALVDQPLVTVRHYRNLLAAFNHEEKNIVISHSSAGWGGVPVVFGSSFFSDLSTLGGEAGAKSIINRYREKVRYVSCDEILDDIDTRGKYLIMLEAYKKLQAY